jgi:3-dehydroquinate dehydratase-2
MLGIREKEIYGDKTYKALISLIKESAKVRKVKVKCYQSNYEGDICTVIQKAYCKYDGIIINPGAFTHTSVAILDALKSVQIPTVEVHITDIHSREEFRNFSYISLYAEKVICGKGIEGYKDAIIYLKDKNMV